MDTSPITAHIRGASAISARSHNCRQPCQDLALDRNLACHWLDLDPAVLNLRAAACSPQKKTIMVLRLLSA